MRDRKVGTGITRERTGYRAYVRVQVARGASRLIARRFPLSATKREMNAWREATRVEARKAREANEHGAARTAIGARRVERQGIEVGDFIEVHAWRTWGQVVAVEPDRSGLGSALSLDVTLQEKPEATPRAYRLEPGTYSHIDFTPGEVSLFFRLRAMSADDRAAWLRTPTPFDPDVNAARVALGIFYTEDRQGGKSSWSRR